MVFHCSVLCIQPESGFWTQHSQTEIVHSNVNPAFNSTIKFYPRDHVDLSTKLRLVLYSVKKSNVEIVSAYIQFSLCFVLTVDAP